MAGPSPKDPEIRGVQIGHRPPLAFSSATFGIRLFIELQIALRFRLAKFRMFKASTFSTRPQTSKPLKRRQTSIV